MDPNIETLIGKYISNIEGTSDFSMTLFCKGGMRVSFVGAPPTIDGDPKTLISGLPVILVSFSLGETSVLSIDGVTFTWDTPVQLLISEPE